MTDFTDSEARIFSFVIRAGNEAEKRSQRGQITRPMLRLNPELKEAIEADVAQLALEAVKARGWAELHDLTRAGYSPDMAEWSADTLAAAGRKHDATREFKGRAA